MHVPLRMIPDVAGGKRVKWPFPMYSVYTAVLALFFLLSLPYWLVQWARQGKYRASILERLGRVPAKLRDRGDQPAIWLHAVSVGEVLAIAGLVGELERAFPDHRIVVSTTTATGQQLAGKRFGEDRVFYFPLDFGFAIRSYLRAVRPQLVVIAETEFWPNFLRLAHASGARIAVVNARISDRSFPGYLRWRRILIRALRPVDCFLAQSAQDRQRLLAIGVREDRVQVTGNLKFDAHPAEAPGIVAQLRAALQAAEARPVIVCGSTVEGEEETLLGVFAELLKQCPHAVMILAPRHPERFEKVADLLANFSGPFVLRSSWNGDGFCGGIFLLDSLGELAAIYALADIAFVGGSLVPRGGHNILEPAQHGVAIVVGPYTENFRDIVESFRSQRALRVADSSQLPGVLLELISHPAERKELGYRAAETLQAHAGATQRTVAALKNLIDAGVALERNLPASHPDLAVPPR
jgi:3-deoxy-D-manno-octulosonic-acid transferase